MAKNQRTFLSARALAGFCAFLGAMPTLFAAPLNRITSYTPGVTDVSTGLELNGTFDLNFLSGVSIGSGTIGSSGVVNYSIVPDLHNSNDLTFNGTATVAAGIGLSGSGIRNVLLNSATLVLNAESYVNQIRLSADSTFGLEGEHLHGSVLNNSGTNNQGSVILNGSGGVYGSVGASGSSILSLSVSDAKETFVNNDLFVKNIEIGDASILEVNGSLFAETIVLGSTGTFSVGSAFSASTLSIAANSHANFNDTIDLSALNFNGNGTIHVFSDDRPINIDSVLNLSGTNQTGILSFSGNSEVNFAIGLSNATLNLVEAGANSKAVYFSNVIYTKDFNIIGDGAVTFLDGSNLYGTINNAGTSGEGILRFLGNQTLTGQVGSSGAALEQIGAGASGKTVTFQSNVYTNGLYISEENSTIELSGNFFGGMLDFGGVDSTVRVAANKNISGSIYANSNNGTLILSGNNTLFNPIGTSSGYFGTVELLGSALVSGNNSVYVNHLNLNNNRLSMNASTGTSVILKSGGTLSTTLNSLTDFGKISTSGAIVYIPSDFNLSVTIADDFAIKTGDAFTIVSVSSPGSNLPGGFEVDSNLSNVHFSVTGGNTMVLTTIRDLPVLNGSASAIYSAIQQGGNAIGSDLNSVVTLITNNLSSAEANNAYEQMGLSQTNRVQARVTSESSGLATQVLVDHMNQGMGMSAGYEQRLFPSLEGSSWIRGFGGKGHQEAIDSIGYNEVSSGGLIGTDVLLNHHRRWGLAMGYAHSHVDISAEPTNQTLKSYQLMTYGKRYFDEDLHLESLLLAALNDYETIRYIQFPGLDRQARAKYHGEQYTFRLGLANRFNGAREYLYPKRHEEWQLIAKASGMYSMTHMGHYTETGAQDLNLRVNGRYKPRLSTELELNLAHPIYNRRMIWTPSIKGVWAHDYLSSLQSTTAAFSGGGATFVIPGVGFPKNGYHFGLNLSALFHDSGQVDLSYQKHYRARYQAESYSLTGRYYF